MAMIAEVLIRISALGPYFWHSWSNCVDVMVVMLCVLTVLMVNDRCTGALGVELSVDAVVLCIRNAVQLVRLFSVIHRYVLCLSARMSRSHRYKRQSAIPEPISFEGLLKA